MSKPIKNGCIRHIANGMRVLIDLKSVAAICERTETAEKVEVHLTSGEVFDIAVPYEEIAGLYLEFLAKERGVMANPTTI